MKYLKLIHKEDLKNIQKCGVYCIYHINKPHIFYIGSTFRKPKRNHQKGFYGRFKEHISLLKRNKHFSLYLQNVINKHKIDGIRFKIIYISNNIIDILEKEEYYISKYNSVNNGYNTSKTCFYSEMSENERKKTSERMTKNNPMKIKEISEKVTKSRLDSYSNPVLQYSLNGIFIKEFVGLKEASLSLNIHESNINRAANGIFKKSGGYRCIFKKDFSDNVILDKVNKIKEKRKIPSAVIQKRTLKQNKKIHCLDLTTNKEYIFNSIKDASIYFKIDAGAISRCCNNIYKLTNNKKFSFIK